jgi:hypothetical protein
MFYGLYHRPLCSVEHQPRNAASEEDRGGGSAPRAQVLGQSMYGTVPDKKSGAARQPDFEAARRGVEDRLPPNERQCRGGAWASGCVGAGATLLAKGKNRNQRNCPERGRRTGGASAPRQTHPERGPGPASIQSRPCPLSRPLATAVETLNAHAFRHVRMRPGRQAATARPGFQQATALASCPAIPSLKSRD